MPTKYEMENGRCCRVFTASYGDLLPQYGWRVLDHTDCSTEHRSSLTALVDALENSVALSDELGETAVAEARAHRQQQISAIDAGLLVREIYFVAAA